MPWKTTRSSQPTMVPPVTFSPFARSAANLTSISTSKRQRRDMKLHKSSARAPVDQIYDISFVLATELCAGSYQDHNCITEVKKFLTKVCQDKNVLDDLRLFLQE